MVHNHVFRMACTAMKVLAAHPSCAWVHMQPCEHALLQHCPCHLARTQCPADASARPVQSFLCVGARAVLRACPAAALPPLTWLQVAALLAQVHAQSHEHAALLRELWACISALLFTCLHEHEDAQQGSRVAAHATEQVQAVAPLLLAAHERWGTLLHSDLPALSSS